MIRKNTNCSQYIRFRRWSRSRYAAFCSLGRCVNIGTLSKSVTEASLRKQNSPSLYITDKEFSLYSESENEVDKADAGLSGDEYLFVLQECISNNEDNFTRLNLVFNYRIRDRYHLYLFRIFIYKKHHRL